MKNMYLEQDNIVLRPVEEDDAEFIRDCMNTHEVRRNLGREPLPINLKQEKEYIEKLSDDEDSVHFLIEYKDNKAGHIFLKGVESRYRKADVGYFVHPEFHGKGIGTISLQLVVKYGFETLNLHRIRGGHLEDNPASRRVMEKAGFQEEGRERHYKYIDGEWHDVLWLSILEDEYYE